MNRQQLTEYIYEQFSVEAEYLWASFPEFAAFRNQRNKKWFALVAVVDRSKLGLEGEGKIDVVNLKCDSVLLGSLLFKKGFLPAYHMSKKSWVTVLLDGSVDEEEIKNLVNFSFEIIDSKK